MSEYLELSCGTNEGNTGIQDCVEEFGAWSKIIKCPHGTSIDTMANALLEATWTTLINSARTTRIYPFPDNFNLEPSPEDDVNETGNLGREEFVREGKDRVIIQLEDISLFNHRELRKHNGNNTVDIYIVTEKGYILGWSSDSTQFEAIPLSKFRVGKRNISDGSTISRTPVSIEFSDAKYWNDYGVWVKPTAFDPLLLDGVKDVNLSGTLGATGTTLTVSGAGDSVGIAGLVAANFDLHLDATPTTAISVTVDTDNGDGTYILTWADQTGNGATTLTLFDQPIGTSGYEANPNGTAGEISATL